MKILDPDELFSLYKKAGSFRQLRVLLADHGIVNPDTGRVWSKNKITTTVRLAKGWKAYAVERDREERSIRAKVQNLAAVARKEGAS